MIRRNAILFAVALCTFLWVISSSNLSADELPKGVLAYMSLDGKGRQVPVAGQKNIKGLYCPTEEKDYDKAEVTREDRYRVEGKFGKGLRFFSKDHSYLQIPDFTLGQGQPTLVVSLFMKSYRSSTSVLVSCKNDGAVSGFSLFSRLNHLHFNYGDGKKSYSVKSKKGTITNGQWHLVKVIFDRGNVKFYVDNKLLGEASAEGKVIKPGTVPLIVGTYPLPGRGREIYSFDGTIDEIIIAQNNDAVTEVLENVANKHGQENVIVERILEASCEPVNGNEVHFGESTFHSFFGSPVPLSFLFKGNKSKINSASLVLYVPEHVVCREAFASNHNLKDQIVKMNETKVQRDGIDYRRYESYGFVIKKELSKTLSVTITVALDSIDLSKDLAKVFWAIKANDKENDSKSFMLRFLKPLASEPNPGRFEIMNYFLADDMAFHDPALQKSVSELFLSSGMRGKGRFYKGDTRRVKFDNKLKEQGFTLYNISLWGGPFSKKTVAMSRPALDVKGNPAKYPCPTVIVNSQKFREAYFEKARQKLSVSGNDEWVAFDFEPWGIPRNICFCQETINEFKKQFGITNNISPAIIKSKYERQWTEFWCQTTSKITKMWSQAVHAANPTLKITEYTYLFNYDDPNLWKRFNAIPKDPRRVEPYVDEYMLSIYHIHGRKLFDSLNKNIKALKKPVCPIVLLSRVNEITGSFTAPEDSLSPQSMYQRAVLCASLGCQRFALYPGKWIDGMYHLALGRASRLIWKHENFFFDGNRCDEKIKVSSANKSGTRNDFAHVVWEKDGKHLLAVYNFTDKPISLIAKLGSLSTSTGKITDNNGVSYDSASKLNLAVEANGVLLVTLE